MLSLGRFDGRLVLNSFLKIGSNNNNTQPGVFFWYFIYFIWFELTFLIFVLQMGFLYL